MRTITFSKIALCVFVACLSPARVRAELYFPPELVATNPQMVADLSHFEKEGSQLPGSYPVDIYLNGSEVTSRNVRFVDAGEEQKKAGQAKTETRDIRDSTGLMACLTVHDLTGLGVNTGRFPALAALPAGQCVSPGQIIPEAFTSFDFQKMRLDISIPQAAMNNSAHGYIPPERWDDGITAALMNYSLSGSENKGRYGDSSSHYLNLRSGLNMGPWRLRDYRVWNDYQSRQSRQRDWQHIETYAERAIIPLHSELLVGDGSTSSDVFDSWQLRGVQLATDDSMYPDSRRGYAPVIRGVASTNARVSIRQKGYVVYQTFVPPGPFSIDDLFPVGSSGDLQVTITEADGAQRTFTVPFSSVPVLQREGSVKYALATGRFKALSNRYSNPDVVQGTLVWGLPAGVTVYGGMQYSGNYLSALLGAGLNIGTLGAFSADVTQADSTLADGSHHQGQSLRFLYARSLNDLGTSFQLTGYRYSTEGFHTLDETALKGMQGWFYDYNTVDVEGRPVKRPYTDYFNLYNNKREKIQVSVSQQVGSLGSLYLSGVRQNYWNTSGVSTSLQAGFNGTVKSVSYSLSLSRNAGLNGSDRAIFASFSIPLDALFYGDSGQRHTLTASYSVNQNADNQISHQASLSGTALEGDRLGWNVSQSYARNAGNGGSLSADYKGGYGETNLGYSYSGDYRQVSYGLSGGAILHSEGLTLGQAPGETNVLVAVPGVPDISIVNETGVHTDWRGYAIVPYASVYRENRVALDTDSLNDQTDIDDAVSRVVPTRGAVVRARFKGYTGSRVLVTLMHDGKPLPFGAMVTAGERGGIVGDEGQVYLSGLSQTGMLEAQWGDGAGMTCSAPYSLQDATVNQAVVRIQADCH
ncbi:fimbrial biogenesis usher protein [Pantoea sp. VH_4]|uniref:fimbrial biogenesis usher protein n=1 Tax=Pantoea sp. VH_4 TaxID=2608047 RepID=UPI001232E4AA|nr:fimbrial biogenesis usher protein [Pantoea sp. VH_4]KAA5930018.1 fimbrial biogenesis usher protein [Pantoea sp. VH_4]